MDWLFDLLHAIGPEHWLILGLVLLIAEMATGTTYLLWPAVAAFITAGVALVVGHWAAELIVFALLVLGLTYFGRPLVARWRSEGAASGLNDRAAALIGAQGVVTKFANGVGSVRVQDTVWRAISEETLLAGQEVTVTAVDGATLKISRAAQE